MTGFMASDILILAKLQIIIRESPRGGAAHDIPIVATISTP